MADATEESDEEESAPRSFVVTMASSGGWETPWYGLGLSACPNAVAAIMMVAKLVTAIAFIEASPLKLFFAVRHSPLPKAASRKPPMNLTQGCGVTLCSQLSSKVNRRYALV
jgi:hypothetical protein